MINKHKCKKLRSGKYLYRGVEITCLGYYPPEQRVVWEGCPIGKICAEFHSFSLKEIKALIDFEYEQNFVTYSRFVDFLFEEIKHKWTKDRPQDFKVCDAEGEEYEKCNQSAYKWFIKMCNGRIPTNIENTINDSVKFTHSKEEVVKRRKELYHSMLETDNIVMWCVENISV